VLREKGERSDGIYGEIWGSRNEILNLGGGPNGIYSKKHWCRVVSSRAVPESAQADEYKKFDLCAEIPGRQPDPVKCGEKPQQGLHTITGEILHMNGANLLLKKTNGEEVLLHIDLSTQMNGQISPGNRIEASVNEVEGEKHVLSLNKTK